MSVKTSDYVEKIPNISKEPVLDIALDTINKNKQAIIFVNSKRSAESVAEKISKKVVLNENEINILKDLSEKILNVLSTPTKQCKRLAICIEKGIAFHHSGLKSEQRKLIEDSFRSKIIKVICATPTLAQGVDLPAYRTIIRDLMRFTSHGMRYIPVLEYEQQSGRAGRPGQETLGQAICFAKDKKDKKNIINKYVFGKPEAILSKLAVEPVLRTYVLSLISTEYCRTIKDLEKFFSKTFFAHQYGDNAEINSLIRKILLNLEEWKLVHTNIKKNNDFVSTNLLKENNEKILPTLLGKRVSELYIDPYTANFIINYLKNLNNNNKNNTLNLLFMFCNCMEIRPRLNIGTKSTEDTESWLYENEDEFNDTSELVQDDFFELLKVARTTMFFEDWIDENTEEKLLEKYNIRPGEINAKVDIMDWLIYSSVELSRFTNKEIIKDLIRLRIRVKNGCKDELIPLLRFKNIGRVRARKLFNADIKNVHDVKVVNYEKLSFVIGKKIALDMKKEVNQEIKEEQKNLLD